MKRLKIFGLSLLFLSLPFYSDAMGVFFHSSKKATTHNTGRRGNQGWYKGGHHGHGNTTGAPLDGGLLTILGAAGVGYFLIRRKKTQQE